MNTIDNSIIITARTRTTNDVMELAKTAGIYPTSAEIESGDFYSRLILGILNKVCGSVNIPITQTEFYQEKDRIAILARGDISKITCNLHLFRESLEQAGKKLNINIRVQKEDLFRYMHRI